MARRTRRPADRTRRSIRLDMRMALIGAAAVALAVAAASDAAGNVFARRNPVLALRLDDDNPRARAALLDARLQSGRMTQLSADDLSALTRAIGQTPLNAALLRDVGIRAEQTGQAAASARLMRLSERVSRRDTLTQLWLIEDAVQRGQIGQALGHYDVALTTSPTLEPLLFPILSGALADPPIRTGLARLFARHRPWVPAFLDQAGRTASPAALATVMVESGLTRDPSLQDALFQLLRRFTASGDIANARKFAGHLAGDRRGLDQFGMSAATLDQRFAPLTWQLSNDGAIRIDPAGSDGILISVPADTRGTVVSRLIAPGPGRHLMTMTVGKPAGEHAAMLTWQWSCLRVAGPAAIGRQDIDAIAGARRVTVPLDVPADCRALQIDLTARGNELAESRVQLSGLTLVRGMPTRN